MRQFIDLCCPVSTEAFCDGHGDEDNLAETEYFAGIQILDETKDMAVIQFLDETKDMVVIEISLSSVEFV